MFSAAILWAGAALLASAIITGLMKAYAQQANLLDVPNQRSSHQAATPRGGGLSFVVVFLGALTWLYVIGDLPFDAFCSLLAGGVLVAGIGFIDDHQHVPAKWRFLVQLVGVSFAVTVLGGLPALQIGSQSVDLKLPGDLMAIFFSVWLINLYNFMDGIDGIAAVEAICVAGGALTLFSVGHSTEPTTALIAVFVAAVSGFLAWNWPPAKIFMGDVGSAFIGFVLAMLAIITSKQGLLPIWSWLILAGVFVVDATVTLVTRILQGEEWYSAHKSHAYQKASRRLHGHKPVTLAVLLINLFWLLPIAWSASVRPEFGWWLTIAAWIPLVLLSLYFKAGRPDPAE